MAFGISQTVKMLTMETSKVRKRNKYSFLRLAGGTMIMDILIQLILTTARRSGDQKQKRKQKLKNIFYFILVDLVLMSHAYFPSNSLIKKVINV